MIVVLVMTILCLNGCKPLIAPIYNESKTITANDGKQFTVLFREDNFPDQEICLLVTNNKTNVFSYYGFANFLSSYDYQNDFVKNYYEIINECNYENIKAYQFNCGIIYTIDNYKTYIGVPKREYKSKCETNSEFETLYEQLNNK